MTLSYVVARLAEVDVAAIAVLGEIEPEAVASADSAMIPLIQLPADASLVEVERSAIATVVDKQAELQRWASEIHRELSQLTFEERGIQAVVDRLAQICGKAVAIEDDQFRFQIGATVPNIIHPEEMDLCSNWQQLAEWSHSVSLSGMHTPVGKFPVPGTPFSRFVALIPARDGVAGYLSVIAPESELTELDRLAASRGASVCAVEVAKEAAVGEAEARLRGDLLDQLLSEDVEGNQVLLGKARRLGYNPTIPSLVIAFKVAPRDSRRAGTPFRVFDRAVRQLETMVRVELSRREGKSLVATRGNMVVAVIPSPTKPTSSQSKELAEDIRSHVQKSLGNYLVAAGVGRSTHAGISLATAFKEAEGALGVGIRVNGLASTTFFGDLGVLRLLAQITNHSELESYCEEVLGKLDEHDTKTGGELLKTLEALFRYNGNLSKTAEQLSLHRNSLLYRLRRVEEISGYNLEDPEIRLSLQVALKARQLLAAERNDG
jgi:purine catabolism regulator